MKHYCRVEQDPILEQGRAASSLYSAPVSIQHKRGLELRERGMERVRDRREKEGG